MGKTYTAINADLRRWIEQQPMMFVATAPLSGEGHVNCSPKGGDYFRILGDREVAYLDLTGSGIETIAHLQENGRVVIMFCSFIGPPKIVRLHGRGQAIYPSDPDFEPLAKLFPPHEGTRAIIRVQLSRISDSCGFGVPLMAFSRHRDHCDKWTAAKGAAGLVAYRQQKNRVSIDQLPGYRV
jgi:hypothetical protein